MVRGEDDFCKPFIRPNLHVCLCVREREYKKQGDDWYEKSALKISFSCKFQAKSATKEESGSYCTLRLLFLCLPQMLEVPLRLRGDGDKN